MSERAAYSRVYWSIGDDPKFVTIYDSDPHLAAWLRLLLIADQSHPASAHLPTNVRRSSVTALADAGLIDLVVGGRYRVHGLDAERERRRLAATTRGNRPPTEPTPNGPRSVTERSPDGIQTPGLRRDETRQAEDETTARTSDDRWADPEHDVMVWLSRHGCDIRPGNGYHVKLVTAVEHHGANALIGMMDRLEKAGTKPGDTKGYLFGAIDALDAKSRPKLTDLQKAEANEAGAQRAAAAVQRTKARVHDSGYHVQADPLCPKCVSARSA